MMAVILSMALYHMLSANVGTHYASMMNVAIIRDWWGLEINQDKKDSVKIISTM